MMSALPGDEPNGSNINSRRWRLYSHDLHQTTTFDSINEKRTVRNETITNQKLILASILTRCKISACQKIAESRLIDCANVTQCTFINGTQLLGCTHVTNCTITDSGAIIDCAFADSRFAFCKLNACELVDCTLSNCIIDNCTITNCRFGVSCIIIDSRMTGCKTIRNYDTAQGTGTNTDGVYSTMSLIIDSMITQCMMMTCDIVYCKLSDSKIYDCAVHDSTLTDSKIIGCAVEASRITKCDITNYVDAKTNTIKNKRAEVQKCTIDTCAFMNAVLIEGCTITNSSRTEDCDYPLACQLLLLRHRCVNLQTVQLLRIRLMNHGAPSLFSITLLITNTLNNLWVLQRPCLIWCSRHMIYDTTAIAKQIADMVVRYYTIYHLVQSPCAS